MKGGEMKGGEMKGGEMKGSDIWACATVYNAQGGTNSVTTWLLNPSFHQPAFGVMAKSLLNMLPGSYFAFRSCRRS
jgi:hypothetical protein